ncbi:MAG: DUF4112 domain-containing protein [Cyanobacteria bacterium J06641_5]
MTKLDPKQKQALARVRSLVRLLDDAIEIPGTKYRIGLDPLLGLFPALGDYLGAILSGYVIWQAARLGVSRETLVKMGANVLLELVAGTAPVLGDAFDVVWKANARNLDLLETHIADPAVSRPVRQPSDRRFVELVLALIGLAALGLGTLSFVIAWLLIRLLQNL